jgi:hypothetical protein
MQSPRPPSRAPSGFSDCEQDRWTYRSIVVCCELLDPMFRTSTGMTEDQNPEPPARISLLLGLARAGDPSAFKAVFEATYPELRSIARARLRRAQPGAAAMLETTALVHEAYLKFASSGELQHEHRAHFFRYASRVMRSVIIDLIREQLAARRGGGSRITRLRPSFSRSLRAVRTKS